VAAEGDIAYARSVACGCRARPTRNKIREVQRYPRLGPIMERANGYNGKVANSIQPGGGVLPVDTSLMPEPLARRMP